VVNGSNPKIGDPCHALAGRAHPPLVISLDGEGNSTADVNGALSAHHSSHNRGAICVTGDTTHALTSEGSDASEDGTGRGTPIVARLVAFDEYVTDTVAGAIKARDYKSATDLVVGTLDAREHGGGSPGTDGALDGHVQAQSGVPRRLTPRECERLMGWPDDHTLVQLPLTGKQTRIRWLSDSARYKACGNGVASVVTHWIGWRLSLALAGEL
jgi:DNA (cytosine-5)-methyltransferase 1